MNSQRLTMISVAVVILVIAAFAIVPRLTATQASGDIDYGANPRLGSPDAPVKVAVFFDFLCPHCASFSANTTPVLEQEFVNDGTAAIYFLNFPVVHPIVSRDVALVGECVFQQGNDIFTQLEPVLMRGQQSLRSRADAIDMALAYAPDLDGGALRDCVASTEAADALAADVAAANQLRITGTPSVAVNGQLVANPTLANLRQAIRNAAN
ncbi:MAG: thioredoxin domain-containing protein [Deinococcales bacterium]|nr:thioredoxin domain-containing protein [Deinococcales bacterium]